jgi:hypothetical protein
MKHLALVLLMLPLFAAAANLRGAVEVPTGAIQVDTTMSSSDAVVTEQYGQMQQLALDRNGRERELFWWWHKKKSTFLFPR